MADWTDAYRGFLEQRYGASPGPDLQDRFAWVGALHAHAREVLAPGALAEMPPAEVYARLGGLTAPGALISLAKLGKANDAERIVEALRRLMEAKGDFAAKFRAAKIPQAGVVAITALLTAVKPQRFAIRNTAFTRALAGVVPLYGKRALDELAYEDFLDVCRELARVQEAWCGGGEPGEWARAHRFLLLYALLTETEG
ncbi:MAG: hypothetical protein ACOCX4_03450 [Planctomycetota bacterium]